MPLQYSVLNGLLTFHDPPLSVETATFPIPPNATNLPLANITLLKSPVIDNCLGVAQVVPSLEEVV